MRNNKLTLLLGLLLLSSLAFVSAGVNEYASVKQGDCLLLRQTCASCSFVNVSVTFKNQTVLDNQLMTSSGALWTYEFCNTTELGRYDVSGYGDLKGVNTGFNVLWFEVTPSGSLMREGDSLVLFGSLLVMIILSSVFLYIASKTESLVGRVTFYCMAFIGYLMSVLYTVVTIQQILFGFDSIITGIETFLFVGKMGVTIGFIALMIVIFLVMLKAWKIKRGFDD